MNFPPAPKEYKFFYNEIFIKMDYLNMRIMIIIKNNITGTNNIASNPYSLTPLPKTIFKEYWIIL